MPVDITVAVPAYNRVRELQVLLNSVLSQTVAPSEVLVIEDNSPLRPQIRCLCEEYSARFESAGIVFRYLENNANLGFDCNIKRLLAEARCSYVMLMGNDDALAPKSIEDVAHFLSANAGALFVSRTFGKFFDDDLKMVGISRLYDKTGLIDNLDADSAKLVFRLSAFIAGLVVERKFANDIRTDKYDGLLYYQFYLACQAYCRGGLAYIDKITALGRADNAPLFGSKQGTYSVDDRVNMWLGVIKIAIENDFYQGKYYGIERGVRSDISGRQAFHVFEMISRGSRFDSVKLYVNLKKNDLLYVAVGLPLLLLNVVFGRSALLFYNIARKVMQR